MTDKKNAFKYLRLAWDYEVPKITGASRGNVKLVLLALVDYASEQNNFKAWPSLDTIATKCSIPRSSVQRAVDVLIDLNLVSKTQRTRPRANQKRNGKTGAMMKNSNLYTVNVKALEGKTSSKPPLPPEGKPIPPEGNDVYPQRVSNCLGELPNETLDHNNFSEEKSPRLNNSPNGQLPRFPDFGNDFTEEFLELEEFQQRVVKNCYVEFHQAASELRYIDHTWNPHSGLDLLAINYERLICLFDDYESGAFYKHTVNRYRARRCEDRQMKVNLSWMLWSNDEDATGYDQVETVLIEGDDPWSEDDEAA
ncbi:helix-turn-helix domain-containing protein [Alteromonas antoniana]|uniref:helix-turn-helix domain-containing protein n=1 Tax=Alteromonas antoniana TaxID=2803813 RepID=UPI001C44BFAE|nr:helix-turn-helix domain-containing protein [Alteromonas antoniana]